MHTRDTSSLLSQVRPKSLIIIPLFPIIIRESCNILIVDIDEQMREEERKKGRKKGGKKKRKKRGKKREKSLPGTVMVVYCIGIRYIWNTTERQPLVYSILRKKKKGRGNPDLEHIYRIRIFFGLRPAYHCYTVCCYPQQTCTDVTITITDHRS